MLFGTAPNQIFLPAAGYREYDGTIYDSSINNFDLMHSIGAVQRALSQIAITSQGKIV